MKSQHRIKLKSIDKKWQKIQIGKHYRLCHSLAGIFWKVGMVFLEGWVFSGGVSGYVLSNTYTLIRPRPSPRGASPPPWAPGLQDWQAETGGRRMLEQAGMGWAEENP